MHPTKVTPKWLLTPQPITQDKRTYHHLQIVWFVHSWDDRLCGHNCRCWNCQKTINSNCFFFWLLCVSTSTRQNATFPWTRERLCAQSDNLGRMAFWIKVAIARRFLFCLAAKECTREKKVQFCSLLIKGQYIFIMVGLGEMKNGYILCFGVSPSPPYPPTYLPTHLSIERGWLGQSSVIVKYTPPF